MDEVEKDEEADEADRWDDVCWRRLAAATRGEGVVNLEAEDGEAAPLTLLVMAAVEKAREARSTRSGLGLKRTDILHDR